MAGPRGHFLLSPTNRVLGKEILEYHNAFPGILEYASCSSGAIGWASCEVSLMIPVSLLHLPDLPGT